MRLFKNSYRTYFENNFIIKTYRKPWKNCISKKDINRIISGISNDWPELKKAYYVYIEIGKVVNEDPEFVFTDYDGKKEHYNDKIDENYYGICKSIAELYVQILRKINISADLVKDNPKSPITHVDTILKIHEKIYLVNLISDLARIKTSSRVKSFGINLRKQRNDPVVNRRNQEYLERLESHYGRIDVVTPWFIEIYDRELGYSYHHEIANDVERGIYTEDTALRIYEEMKNPEWVKEYVLDNREVPSEDIFEHKLDYILNNINNMTKYNGNMHYLENIRFYMAMIEGILNPDREAEIKSYVATIGDDISNIISILKVKILKKEKNNNLYYIYSQKDKKYIKKTPEEMNLFIDQLREKNLRIIGEYDYYKPQEISELELQ